MKNIFEQYPVIAFKDIKKGDTIASVTTYEKSEDNGDVDMFISSVGVAHRLRMDNATQSWRTEDNWVVAWADNAAKHHLIDRPKLKLPTESGAVIFIKKYDGAVLEKLVLAVVDSDGDWFVPNGYDNSAINASWIYSSDEYKIEDFALAEVKEVTA